MLSSSVLTFSLVFKTNGCPAIYQYKGFPGEDVEMLRLMKNTTHEAVFGFKEAGCYNVGPEVHAISLR